MTEMYPERGPYEPPDLNAVDFSITSKEEFDLRIDGFADQHAVHAAKAKEGIAQLSELYSGETNDTLNTTVKAIAETTKIYETVLWAGAMRKAGLSFEDVNKIIALKSDLDQERKRK